MIVDTHCHLDCKRFEDDLADVIKRAKEHGVKKFIIPAADPLTFERAFEISEIYEDVYFSVGVHPCNAMQFNEDFLRKFITHEKCIAVGECGLDYFRLKDMFKDNEKLIEDRKKLQKEIFIKQIELAIEFKKPLIVHIREASSDAKEILMAHNAKEVGGVLHCYNADEQLLELVDHGFYYGIGGVITFKNAKKLPQVLPKVPLDRLVIETDAPYLTPHPHRGKRNEPYYTVLVAEKIAEILQMEVQDIENITTKNSCNLFGIKS